MQTPVDEGAVAYCHSLTLLISLLSSDERRDTDSIDCSTRSVVDPMLSRLALTATAHSAAVSGCRRVNGGRGGGRSQRGHPSSKDVQLVDTTCAESGAWTSGKKNVEAGDSAVESGVSGELLETVETVESGDSTVERRQHC